MMKEGKEEVIGKGRSKEELEIGRMVRRKDKRENED